MIIFRRKKREQIVIDGNIVVTIMHIRGSRVSLGIEAPEGVRILRTELSPHSSLESLSSSESVEVMHAAQPIAN